MIYYSKNNSEKKNSFIDDKYLESDMPKFFVVEADKEDNEHYKKYLEYLKSVVDNISDTFETCSGIKKTFISDYFNDSDIWEKDSLLYPLICIDIRNNPLHNARLYDVNWENELCDSESYAHFRYAVVSAKEKDKTKRQLVSSNGFVLLDSVPFALTKEKYEQKINERLKYFGVVKGGVYEKRNGLYYARSEYDREKEICLKYPPYIIGKDKMLLCDYESRQMFLYDIKSQKMLSTFVLNNTHSFNCDVLASDFFKPNLGKGKYYYFEPNSGVLFDVTNFVLANMNREIIVKKPVMSYKEYKEKVLKVKSELPLDSVDSTKQKIEEEIKIKSEETKRKALKIKKLSFLFIRKVRLKSKKMKKSIDEHLFQIYNIKQLTKIRR